MSSFCCKKCGAQFEFSLPSVINVASAPELKEKVLDGSLFLKECPVCGEKNLVQQDLLYIDPGQKLLLVLSSQSLSSSSAIPDYEICRQLSSVGELIEKIKIFDASLDDIAIELCKYITSQEMEQDVALKFLKMEGADNELIFAYPKDGRMEMLSIGLNVYEDCCNIIRRNPSMTEQATGLARIDSAWLSKFLA